MDDEESTISTIKAKWMVRAVCRPPEQLRQEGQRRIHAGRHGQPGDDHQRQEDEDTAK